MAWILQCFCGGVHDVDVAGRAAHPGAGSGKLGEPDLRPTGPSTILLDGLTSFRSGAAGAKEQILWQAKGQDPAHDKNPSPAKGQGPYDSACGGGARCQPSGSSGKWVSGAALAAPDCGPLKASSDAVAAVTSDGLLPSCRSLSHSAAAAAGRASRSFRRRSSSRVLPAEMAAGWEAGTAGGGGGSFKACSTGSGNGSGSGNAGGGVRPATQQSQRPLSGVAQQQQQLAATVGTMFRATGSFARRHSNDPLGSALQVVRSRVSGPAYLSQRAGQPPKQLAQQQSLRLTAHSFTVASTRSPSRTQRINVRPTADGFVPRSPSMTAGAGRSASVTSGTGRSVSMTRGDAGRSAASTGSGAGAGRGAAVGAPKRKPDGLRPLKAAAMDVTAAAAAMVEAAAAVAGGAEDELPTGPRVAHPAPAASHRSGTFPSRSLPSYTRYNQPVEALKALQALRAAYPDEGELPGKSRDCDNGGGEGEFPHGSCGSEGGSTASADRPQAWEDRAKLSVRHDGRLEHDVSPSATRGGQEATAPAHQAITDHRASDDYKGRADEDGGRGQEQPGVRALQQTPSRGRLMSPPPSLHGAGGGHGGAPPAAGWRYSARQLLTARVVELEHDDSGSSVELIGCDAGAEAAARRAEMAAAAAAAAAQRAAEGDEQEAGRADDGLEGRRPSQRWLLSRTMQPQKSILKKSQPPGLLVTPSLRQFPDTAVVASGPGAPAATDHDTEPSQPSTPEPRSGSLASVRGSTDCGAAAAPLPDAGANTRLPSAAAVMATAEASVVGTLTSREDGDSRPNRGERSVAVNVV